MRIGRQHVSDLLDEDFRGNFQPLVHEFTKLVIHFRDTDRCKVYVRHAPPARKYRDDLPELKRAKYSSSGARQRIPWTQEETLALIEHHRLHPEGDWCGASLAQYRRTNDDCRDRWQQSFIFLHQFAYHGLLCTPCYYHTKLSMLISNAYKGVNANW